MKKMSFPPESFLVNTDLTLEKSVKALTVLCYMKMCMNNYRKSVVFDSLKRCIVFGK